MTISDRRGQAKMPTATAKEHRLGIYQPTRRPSWLDRQVATSWGVVRVVGKLGQAHADVMDALLYCAERRRDLEDGRIKILVDPARVRRVSGVGSGEQFRRLLDELMAAVVEIREPASLCCLGHLVDHVDMARRSDGTLITRRNPLDRGERSLWRVELGKALCTLLEKDIWRGYNPAPIARLRHGISQAIARHMLSHSKAPRGGWIIDNLIRVVAGEISGGPLRHRRRELVSDAESLGMIGLHMEGDRLHRVQQKPDSVQQKPDSVQQKPDVCSKSPALAGMSDLSGSRRAEALEGAPP